jgi:hypothetical protein
VTIENTQPIVAAWEAYRIPETRLPTKGADYVSAIRDGFEEGWRSAKAYATTPSAPRPPTMPNLPTNTANEAMRELPSYDEAADKPLGERTALERFIADNEPAGVADERRFRKGLAAVLHESSLPAAAAPGECMDCAYNPGLCDTHDAAPQLAGEEAVASALKARDRLFCEAVIATQHSEAHPGNGHMWLDVVEFLSYINKRRPESPQFAVELSTPSLAGQAHSAAPTQEPDLDDIPACIHCGAMAGACAAYPNCPNGPLVNELRDLACKLHGEGRHGEGIAAMRAALEIERLGALVVPAPSQTHSAPGGDEERDAARLDWLAGQFKTCTIAMSGEHPHFPGGPGLRDLRGPTFRAAIDAAIAKDSSA